MPSTELSKNMLKFYTAPLLIVVDNTVVPGERISSKISYAENFVFHNQGNTISQIL